MYAGNLRHTVARERIVNIFKEITTQHNSKRPSCRQYPIDGDELEHRIRERGLPRSPIALTPRIRRALVQLARAVRVQLPMLVTGPTGCGKTTLVLVLAELCQASVRQVYMTAETESSLLVGSMKPEGDLVDWEDGVITRCVTTGDWAMLDNLADADSCVLERLNPCLESKVDWRLTERGRDGDDEAMEVHRRFRFFATMTTGLGGQQPELSPALYNRFTIVHLVNITDASNIPEAQAAAFKAEVCCHDQRSYSVQLSTWS